MVRALLHLCFTYLPSIKEPTDAPAVRKVRRCRKCRGEGHDARTCKGQSASKKAKVSTKKKIVNDEVEDLDDGFVTGSDATEDDK